MKYKLHAFVITRKTTLYIKCSRIKKRYLDCITKYQKGTKRTLKMFLYLKEKYDRPYYVTNLRNHVYKI